MTNFELNLLIRIEKSQECQLRTLKRILNILESHIVKDKEFEK